MREQLGFEERDAVETPGGVGEFLGELGLGGVAGWYSAKNCWEWRWYAAGSSVTRMGERLVRPWVTAFCEERCLPAAVRGPVERRALARFARLRAGCWLLGIGVGIGFVMRASSTVVAWVDGEFRG